MAKADGNVRRAPAELLFERSDEDARRAHRAGVRQHDEEGRARHDPPIEDIPRAPSAAARRFESERAAGRADAPATSRRRMMSTPSWGSPFGGRRPARGRQRLWARTRSVSARSAPIAASMRRWASSHNGRARRRVSRPASVSATAVSRWSSAVVPVDEPHPLQHPDVAPDGRSVKLGEPGEFGQRDRSCALDPPHQAELRHADPGRGERLVVKRGRLAGGGAQRGAIAGGIHTGIYLYRRAGASDRGPDGRRRAPPPPCCAWSPSPAPARRGGRRRLSSPV